jgi:organic radical activating enzyme
MNLNVKEIFYSLQGEGGRQGEASIFIRLSRCNLHCDFCDTDFTKGTDMDVNQILSVIQSFPCQWIVWTGGEPTLQLTDDILLFFKEKAYLSAIESNGTNTLSGLLDYTVISPKEHPEQLVEINETVNEIRVPVSENQLIPDIACLPRAQQYFLSPVFTDSEIDTRKNINYCVEYIKAHPQWRLSLQIHKLIGIE